MDAAEILPTGKFTKPQLDLLKMFSATIPAKDWEAIRKQVKLYFAKKATEEMDKIFEDKGWNDKTMDELLTTHMRSSNTK